MSNPSVDEVKQSKEGMKSDGAEVPTFFWNDRLNLGAGRAKTITKGRVLKALEFVRNRLHSIWCTRVARSFWRYVIDEKKRCATSGEKFDSRILRAGLPAIKYALESDWWEWKRGSAMFFWRWPPHCRVEIRDGLAPRFLGPPPRYRQPQRVPADSETVTKIRKKLSKFRDRGYITAGSVESLMSLFDVPKGQDIRLVFHGTSCGLNDVLWAPWFALPTVDSMLATVDVGYWCADNDIGEMFYNFWLHETLRNLCGVDLTSLFMEEMTEGQRTLWERWNRAPMGITTSPYQAVGGAMNFKRLVLGEPNDDGNIFSWSTVVENLPGTPQYDPSLPWVYKVRSDGRIAADVHMYVDDGRTTAWDKEAAWMASSKFSKTAAYLGMQDALRKRWSPSQTPDDWFGSRVITTEEGVYKTVSKERWLKLKGKLAAIQEELRESLSGNKDDDQQMEKGSLNFKSLQKNVGYLVYMAMTFRAFQPFLKGFYLTLYGWRRDRDPFGWKVEKVKFDRDKDEYEMEAPEDAPEYVSAVPRLRQDLGSLIRLTDSEEPLVLRVRPHVSSHVVLGFGDAAKHGYGLTAADASDPGHIEYEHGVWGDTIKATSSNHKEMLNFVNWLERGLETGAIRKGTEIFLFTDNYVTERAFFRGTASTPSLFELVMKLVKMEMEGEIFLHLIWVAGTRLIDQGVDGLSRGDLENGVMTGKQMLQFVPVHLSALQRSGTMMEWLSSWVGEEVRYLTTQDWFHEAHRETKAMVWTPAPPIADAALTQLFEARHTRPYVTHIVIIPNLMTYKWRKSLRKAADVFVTMPKGHHGACGTPSLSVNLRLTCQECGIDIVEGKGIVCANSSFRRLHWRPCQSAWHADCYVRLDGDDYPIHRLEDDVDGVLDEEDLEEAEGRFVSARDGDHLMCPFQCDLCHFRNIQKRDPGSDVRDPVLLKAIRRAILDAFWSRETSTVKGNLSEWKHVLRAANAYGVQNPPRVKLSAPYPVEDEWGMFEATALLHRSLDKGKNADTIQYNTMRKLRSFFSNMFHTKESSTGMASLAGDHGGHFFTESPTYGFWFKRFISGCHRRMGDLVFPDRPLTIDELLAIQGLMEEDWEEAETKRDQEAQYEIANFGVALLVGYSAALRGEEIPKLELAATRSVLEESLLHPRFPHVTLGLKGRVKGERHARCHLIPLVLNSKSGIENGKWLQRLLDLYERKGLVRGSLIRAKRNGRWVKAKVSDMDKMYHSYLNRVQVRSPHILNPNVDVEEETSFRRSLRRGSVAQARNVDIPQDIIESNARWRKVERARGRQVSMGMMEHYSDVRAIIEVLLRYSGPL